MACIFCDIIQGKKQGHFIYEDDTHVAFLDKYPIDHGHSLVLPREHFEKVTDMTADKVGDLFSKVPKIAKAIIQTTHVHVHIIPRFNDKGTIWTKREIGNDDALKILAEKIRKCI